MVLIAFQGFELDEPDGKGVMTATIALPPIIQGGLGVGISNWSLARAVSMYGQLGVVSGTCLDTVLIRRLQDGDIGGHLRRAMAQFPIPEMASEVLSRYFQPEGRPEGVPYPVLPMYKQMVDGVREQLTVVSNFVEVYLAKEGHDGPIGLNLLTKIQMPNLPSLYGAMLAGVDYVLMGAGIPKDIPGALDRMADHEPAVTRLEVNGPTRNGGAVLEFDPSRHWEEKATPLKRPKFLPIVSSHTLASMLVRKGSGRVDGFVVEGPTAGGHNAPPRGEVRHTDRGEPVYGERDEADLEKIADLGLPFWVAGGTGHPRSIMEVRRAGGEGIQVGTLFAFCEESALKEEFKKRVLDLVRAGQIDVLTDPRCSPTGFPFKIVQLPDSLSSEETYRHRERVCDLGYLRTAYVMKSGRIGFRCPAEPVKTFVKKGGSVDETEGRKCLCNALLANVNVGQLRPGGELEMPLITSGDDLKALGEFLGGRSSYSAGDVIEYLLS